MASRYKDHSPGEWVDMWKWDKRSIASTMLRNLSADLDVGRELDGKTVFDGIIEILVYAFNYKKEVLVLSIKDVEAAGRWCFDDMKRRGTIE